MNIDLRTLILVVGIANLIQVIALFFQYLINKSYRGVGWWLLAFSSLAVGFIFTLLRDVTTVKLITIVAGSTLTFSGPVFVYIGVMRFLGKKENRRLVFWLYVAFLLPYFYFTYVNDDINIRSTIGAVMVAFYSFLTAHRVFIYKTRAINASATFLSVAWYVQGIFFVFRVVDLLTASPIVSYFTPTLIQASTFLFTLIISSLVTFGLIIMINQRSSAEARDAENQFELIFHTSPDSTVITRLNDGVIVDINEGFLALSGFTKEETIGKSILDMNIYENPADRQKIVDQLVEKGFCENYEALFQRKDGSLIHGVLSAKTFLLNNIPHVISITRDVSESEKRFRTLFEQAAVGVALIETRTGRYIDINQKYCDLLGYTKEEMLNMTFQAVTFPDDIQENLEHNALLIAGKIREFSLEKRLIRKDGSIVWGNLSVSPLWLPEEKPVDYFHIFVLQDITERKRAEAALRKSESSLAEAQRISRIGSWEWDLVSNTLVWSEEMYQIFGLTPGMFDGKLETLLKFVHPDDRENFISRMEDNLKRGAELPLEYRIIRPDGEERTVHAQGKIILDEEGRPFKEIGTEQDITEAKQLELEKQNLYDQLVQAKKMESVGRLAGGVAHDFNNLLGVIIGRAESAQGKISPQHPVYQDLQEILEAGNRSADLTRQLLAFARKQPMNPVVMDLNCSVASILEMLRRLIGEDIELVWKPDPGLWRVWIDSSQVGQILTNLLVNARDAISGMGKVVIETGNVVCDETDCAKNPGMIPGEYALLSVSDDGSGMDAETFSHLFEPFFTTKGVGKGTGLGLPTVFGIVKQNNGYIKVTSEPGQGTTMWVYLPRVTEELAPTPTSEPVETARGKAVTILIVDDEAALLEMGKEALEDWGYHVLAAGSPEDALRLAQEHGADIRLLITDVIMPGMNGQVLSERLRAVLPGLKCLFMSGYNADIITDRGMMPDAVSFIQKPFSLGALAVKVKEVLGQK